MLARPLPILPASRPLPAPERVAFPPRSVKRPARLLVMSETNGVVRDAGAL